MQGVEAGGYLHGLNLIDSLACGVQGTAQIQRRTTVCVVVLNYQILYLLGVNKGGCEGMLLCLDIVVILKTVLGKEFLYLLVRARGDLINH